MLPPGAACGLATPSRFVPSLRTAAPRRRAPLQNLHVFLAHGIAPFLPDYRALSVLIGRRVTLHTGAADAPATRGVVVDHGDDGALVVRVDGAADAAPHARFLSGEVTRLELEGGAEAAAAAPPGDD